PCCARCRSAPQRPSTWRRHRLLRAELRALERESAFREAQRRCRPQSLQPCADYIPINGTQLILLGRADETASCRDPDRPGADQSKGCTCTCQTEQPRQLPPLLEGEAICERS